jgi:phosphatidate cytidylyltransferase
MFKHKAYALSPLWIGVMILSWEVKAVWPTGPWHELGVVVAILSVTMWALMQARSASDQQERGRQWRRRPAEQWALTVAVGAYLGIGGTYLIRLRAAPDGLWWTLTTCLIVWIGDSAAYFAGSQWGRHKMAPSISPGKTWEGYGAQIISGLVTGALLGWLWPAITGAATFTVLRGTIVGGVISALCPAGDFFVSMMKREVEVKDTSNLIPGHGGILDRMDSLIWAGILAYTIIGPIV